MLTQVFLIMKEKEKIDNMKIFGWQAKVGGNVITDGYLLAKDQWTECGSGEKGRKTRVPMEDWRKTLC